MFETHETARVNLPSEFAGNGEFAWEYVYSRLHMHWFHVVAKSTHDTEGYQELRNLFLVHIEDLVTVSASSAWAIQEVQLVSPAHMNGKNRWMMEPLAQILKGRESKLENEQYGHVFVLENGERYVWAFGNREQDLTDLISIYDTDA